jgi:hypothetical protein
VAKDVKARQHNTSLSGRLEEELFVSPLQEHDVNNPRDTRHTRSTMAPERTACVQDERHKIYRDGCNQEACVENGKHLAFPMMR